MINKLKIKYNNFEETDLKKTIWYIESSVTFKKNIDNKQIKIKQKYYKIWNLISNYVNEIRKYYINNKLISQNN